MFIYKISPKEEYKLFISKGYTEGSMADKEEGFIHLSTRTQLYDTINKHFSNLKILFISSFFINPMDTNLKWEISRNSEFFPHYYGILYMKDRIYSIRIQN